MSSCVLYFCVRLQIFMRFFHRNILSSVKWVFFVIWRFSILCWWLFILFRMHVVGCEIRAVKGIDCCVATETNEHCTELYVVSWLSYVEGISFVIGVFRGYRDWWRIRWSWKTIINGFCSCASNWFCGGDEVAMSLLRNGLTSICPSFNSGSLSRTVQWKLALLFHSL